MIFNLLVLANCALLGEVNYLPEKEEYTPKNYSHLLGMKGFSDPLLKMHFQLYVAYVKNTNDLLQKLQSDLGTQEYAGLKRQLGWEFDGMRLHELYFDNLGGTTLLDTESSFSQKIISQFGSFENWKKDFIKTGSMRGIGWAILYYDPQLKKLINTWINEHDVGHLATSYPILVMDVFEHAYITQYGLNRAQYIDAFFANIDWSVVAARFDNLLIKPGYDEVQRCAD